MVSVREPIPDELSVVARHLAELRRVFAAWSRNYTDDFDLLWFAYYESCDEPVMASAAPFVVGESLVRRDGFRWVMVRAGDVWHHGVAHPLLAEPIDVTALDAGAWYRPDPDDEPPRPGEAALDSLEFIKLVVDWRRYAGPDAAVPAGPISEVERAVAEARSRGYWRFRRR